MTDEKLAHLVMRRLRRNGVEVPASDQGEIQHYVWEGYDNLTARSSDEYDPRALRPDLARKAVRYYAMWQYADSTAMEEEYERALNHWQRQAAVKYGSDKQDDKRDSEEGYTTPAQKIRGDIDESLGEKDYPARNH